VERHQTSIAPKSVKLIAQCDKAGLVAGDSACTRRFHYLGQAILSKCSQASTTDRRSRRCGTPQQGGRCFAPSAIQFIRSLPDKGRLFIRATGYGGETVEGEFNLANVSDVREKISAACVGAKPAAPAMQVQPPRGGASYLGGHGACLPSLRSRDVSTDRSAVLTARVVPGGIAQLTG
jgi:hypothetical protein